jgi:hypothetical protein
VAGRRVDPRFQPDGSSLSSKSIDWIEQNRLADGCRTARESHRYRNGENDREEHRLNQYLRSEDRACDFMRQYDSAEVTDAAPK